MKKQIQENTLKMLAFSNQVMRTCEVRACYQVEDSVTNIRESVVKVEASLSVMPKAEESVLTLKNSINNIIDIILNEVGQLIKNQDVTCAFK